MIDDGDEDDVDMSLEEMSTVKVRRPAPQKQTSIARKKRLEKEEEAQDPVLKTRALGGRPNPQASLKSWNPRNEEPGIAWLQ